MIETLEIDCIEYMRKCPDKYFDIANVDPPYGIGQNWSKDRAAKFYNHRNDFNNSVPGKEYFEELFRISKNQIIWGANYFWNYLAPSNNLIFWDKHIDATSQHMSSGELAWTSFTKYPFMRISLKWNGFIKCENTVKIHPHQKPVLLYKRLLDLYAKPGDLIFDSHSGSFSHAVACKQAGFSGVFCEIDPEYFRDGKARVENTRQQYELISTEKVDLEQLTL